MKNEQIRARQLMKDLKIQAKELKEEISTEMIIAITRALEQSYTLSQEDKNREAIKKLKEIPGKNNLTGANISQNKLISLGKVMEIYDIRVTKSGSETILKTTEQ
jgi:post-segregation antitoxin (ccd killing protein)